jgi:glutamate carboxypeptidase
MARESVDWPQALPVLRREKRHMVRLLGEFVRMESPSFDKEAIDRLGKKVASEWRQRGAKVEVLHQKERGNHLRAELWLGQGRPEGQILVLGHLDTVYPRGTLENMPFRIARGNAWGPGTFDMKGGLVLALFAVDALRKMAVRPRKRLVCLWTSDEEIGSKTSRRFIEGEAKRSDAVLVLEPALGATGRLKTRRKGIGGIEIVVTGRAAHAGVNPDAGVNAVHELALQIVRLTRLNDRRRGITVQTNVIEGGTVSNVVAARARAQVDVRYIRAADAPGLRRKLRSLRPILNGARVEVRGGLDRPPLERTAAVRDLFRKAQALARELGFALEEGSTGGGSDGNFTAALGVPTLDGLGVVGGGAHSLREHIRIRALPERAALLAALLATL